MTFSDNFKFVKENEVCRILSYKGKVFGVEPPTFVTLEVTETEPGLKGNTATNTLKPAKVETGAAIRVPLFINEGDMIRIDTRTCEYMERAYSSGTYNTANLKINNFCIIYLERI